MQYRLFLSSLAALLLSAVAAAVEPADLKPGLVATFSDVTSNSVMRLEPTAALVWAKGESPHPMLHSSGQAAWKGYINVTRPGKYQFAAVVAGGRVSVKISGKSVLNAQAETAEPRTVAGQQSVLDGGVIPIEIEFKRVEGQGAARLELLWEGPGFIREPLNNRFLGHLPAERPKHFLKDVELEHGRFLFEELACAKCHKPGANNRMAGGLANRTGPNLTEIARRAYPGWIDAWLAEPSKLRPETTMPKLFTDDERGRAERFAVTKYLVSLSGTALTPYKPPIRAANDVRQSTERGRVLYSVTGCATCHQGSIAAEKNEGEDREPLKPEDHLYSLGTAGPSAKYTLGAVGSKTRFEALATYLQDPLRSNPAGRMPHMNLGPQEATDLARFLCRVTDDSIMPEMPAAPRTRPHDLGKELFAMHQDPAVRNRIAALEKLPIEKQWIELGRTLTEAKGCLNCHTVEVNGKALGPLSTFAGLDTVKSAGTKGCIGESRDAAIVPVYRLKAAEKSALAAFLKSGLNGAGTPATTYQARIALRRFNCLNCHSRDGEGGIPTELADQMRLLEKAENADDVRPPLLTGIGHKARTSWLRSVLLERGRARPWMQLRMPQYGKENIGSLPAALAHLEGAEPDDAILKLPLNTQTIQTGRQIVGKSGLGCISCHDIGGIANTGTRGPDLATINQRVRYEWYERWMHQPLRMAPGTRMPQAFVDGRSTLTSVLAGDPRGQAEAMWAYLSLGPGLPLPEGLEPPKGLVVAVKDRPYVLRTFMPDAGSKAIAVGYPGGVNLAFSADQCRLAYAWGGNFVDATPVWNNRGGSPAKILGPKFWTAPDGHPWGITTNPRIPPDFAARANNPAFGMPLPLEPARVFDGPMAVHFDGYALDRSGRPTFRYSLDEAGRGAKLKIAETPAPIRDAVATGFRRTFDIEVPAGNYSVWLLAAQSAGDPRLISASGGPAPALDLKGEEPLVAAAGVRVVLPQEADRVVVIEAVGAPGGTMWRLVKRSGGRWQILLRLPDPKSSWKGKFDLMLWALPKDDEALLKELGSR